MVAVPKAMAGRPRVVGLLVETRAQVSDRRDRQPEEAVCSRAGGAKVSDKMPAI
jgi:phosphoglycerate kinase